MASTINADDGVVSGSAGVKTSADNSGVLELQSNGTTQFTLGSSSVVINEAGADVDFRVEGDTDSNLLFVDASTDRVGVGTSSPSDKVHVVGSVRSSNAGNSVYSSLATDGVYAAGTDLYLLAPSTKSIIFYSNNTASARIDASGNFGLGVTPSAWSTAGKIIQFGNGNASIGTQNNGDANFMHNAYESPGGTFKYILSGIGALRYNLDINNNVHKWFTAPSGTAGNTISFTQAMTLDASGNLLVGKTSAGATTLGVEARASGKIVSTLAASTNADDTLNVYSTGAGAYRFYVEMDGKVNATNTTIAAISDQRLKENIRDLDAGLVEILALKPRTFDWKEGKGANTKDARGFIAQEFEQVFPDMIDTWKDPAPEGEEPYKAVRADLIPVLVKSIQEQQAMIEDLKAKVAALESK